jgi:hypothetical protein
VSAWRIAGRPCSVAKRIAHRRALSAGEQVGPPPRRQFVKSEISGSDELQHRERDDRLPYRVGVDECVRLPRPRLACVGPAAPKINDRATANHDRASSPDLAVVEVVDERGPHRPEPGIARSANKRHPRTVRPPPTDRLGRSGADTASNIHRGLFTFSTSTYRAVEEVNDVCTARSASTRPRLGGRR